MNPILTKPEPLDAASRARRLVAALEARGITAEYAATGEAAKERVLARIPRGARVMTGSSVTLDAIGVTRALADGEYDSLKDRVRATEDAAARHRLRKESTLADWFLGSAPAITEDGRIVAVDASGSRIGGYAYGAEHVVLVVSAQKIVPTLEDAFTRIRDHVFPREDARQKAAGAAGSTFGKWLIIEREIVPDRMHVVLVGEPLGY